MKKLKQQLESLIVDSQLAELCELQRTGDEIFDVINLSENQHSDILAWMFDAREGHGQGDEILRDMLMAASISASNEDCALDKQSTTGRFFSRWPPSRIRTTSFGAAFIARELGLEEGKRTDLFVVDVQNKVIIAIENKAGTPQREKQLESYRQSFEQAVASNAKLRKYEQVCIALDRRFDEDDPSPKVCADAWLHIGYDWLEASADRAVMHVERGNSAARLVMSYCERQTDWYSEFDEQCLALAVELHRKHPEAVMHLLELSRQRLESFWLNDESADPYLLFLLQNKGIVKLLKKTRGMESVRAAILSSLTEFDEDHIQYNRTWLNLRPSEWEFFVWQNDSGEDEWPVSIRVEFAESSKTKYNLLLVWDPKNAESEEDAECTRKYLQKIDPAFYGLSRKRSKSIVVGQALDLDDLLSEIQQLDFRLTSAHIEDEPEEEN